MNFRTLSKSRFASVSRLTLHFSTDQIKTGMTQMYMKMLVEA